MTKVLLLLTCLTCSAKAGFETLVRGARTDALGQTSVVSATDAWATLHNVGNLAWFDSREVDIAYLPQPFGLVELSSMAIAAAASLGPGVAAAAIQRFGYDLYHEMLLNVSYATVLAGVGVGFGFSRYSVSISRYGSASAVGIDAGLLAQIGDQLAWGFAARNLNAATIGASEERLPQSFSTGMRFSPMPEATLAIEYRKESRFDPSIQLGIEYWLVDAMAIRAGFSEDPPLFTGGLGLRYESLGFDYAIISHADLGWTHELGLTIRWGRQP